MGGDECTKNGAKLCTECKDGFELNAKKTACTNGNGNNNGNEKKCTCQNGTPAKGDECTKNGAKLCTECKDGFKLNAKKTACTNGNGNNQKKCKCQNGTPAEGDECKKNNAKSCASCNDGFQLNAKKTACQQSKK